jgi:hypothetical protein
MSALKFFYAMGIWHLTNQEPVTVDVDVFFLEYAGGLRIIVLIEGKSSRTRLNTQQRTHTEAPTRAPRPPHTSLTS